MPADWNQAVDAQTDLISLWGSSLGYSYARAFVESAAKQLFDPDTGSVYEVVDEEYENQVQNGVTVLAHAFQSLKTADPFWVDADVCDLIEVAAETFQPEAIYLDDLLTDDGFAYFEKPVFIKDINGIRTAFRALGWARADSQRGEVVVLTLYCHREDPDDYMTSEGMLPRLGSGDLTLGHYAPILFGNASWLGLPPNIELARFIQVFWRLAQQQIAIPGLRPVARATRRRAKWKEIKNVTVFTLRRLRNPSKEEEEEGGTHWTHRWMVRGHWRNQPYKIGGEIVHRQIWIAPYVKGPDGLPFVAKRRVFDFRR